MRDVQDEDPVRRALRLARFAPSLGAVAVASLCAGAISGRALAATACGTLVTNVANTYMWSGAPDFIEYPLTYNVTATVKVICPVTAFMKYADRGMASSGSTLTFYMCVDNQRMSVDGSVWNVTITDRLPDGVGFIDWNTNNYGGTVSWQAWKADTAPNGWTTTAPVVGQLDPLYLRWAIASIAPMKSACVSYRVTVL